MTRLSETIETTATQTRGVTNVVAHPACSETQLMPVYAKKIGFTGFLFGLAQTAVAALFKRLADWHQTSQDYRTVRTLLTFDDTILDDMALSRGDIHHVLSTRTEKLPSERLRLIAVERRAAQRGDFRRRAAYLDALTPVISGTNAQSASTVVPLKG
eukprot:TRINITY_DN73616_c0_g1_i1.p1 TRINITY_DN73616_c0_g1~~TRINITY_DN73616_c0_g1_i1.p1  ORF type:complete len:157 (-),score=5.28 TRINITY_DN73616_c0_g1_i1:17-487(-)